MTRTLGSVAGGCSFPGLSAQKSRGSPAGGLDNMQGVISALWQFLCLVSFRNITVTKGRETFCLSNVLSSFLLQHPCACWQPPRVPEGVQEILPCASEACPALGGDGQGAPQQEAALLKQISSKWKKSTGPFLHGLFLSLQEVTCHCEYGWLSRQFVLQTGGMA